MKIHMTSLGCDKNNVDAEQMQGALSVSGHGIVENPADADVLIVNTCCFIDSAKEESIDTILEVAQFKKVGQQKYLLVTGCMAERFHQELAESVPEIDGFIGVGHIDAIVSTVESLDKAAEKKIQTGDINCPYNEEMPRYMKDGQWTAYLKISEGCDNHCTYCVIPQIRGKHRSRKPEDIYREAAFLQDKGVRELILIAQDTGRYGCDLEDFDKDNINLAKLVAHLAENYKFTWIRILYLYPEGITDELLTVMASHENICHYLDMPIQHTEDRVLQRMGRRVDRKTIFKTVARIREIMPDVVLRTSIITGFPGETEAEHEALLTALAELKIDRLGAFMYSREDGTPAAAMEDQIAEDVKQRRFQEIYEQQQGITAKVNRRFVGNTYQALIETKDENGVYGGRIYADAPEIDCAVLIESGNYEPGHFYEIPIIDSFEYDLIGGTQ